MATSTVPRGRLEVAARRGESLHPAWAIDADGQPTRSPLAALEGALMPLGGTEEAGGYKGYGLTLIVDVLTGVLGGSTPGPLIAPLFSPARGGSDIAQTFIVIDPDALGEPARSPLAWGASWTCWWPLASHQGRRAASSSQASPRRPPSDVPRSGASSSTRPIIEACEVLADRFGEALPVATPLGSLATGAR